MAENEELKKFKCNIEESQKEYAIQEMMNELEEKVVLPEEAKEEMIAEAEKYSLDNIEAWRNYCKAKSFEFATREDKNSEVVVVGLASITAPQAKDDLWA